VAALLLLLTLSGCAVQQQDGWQEDRDLVMKSLEDAHLKAAKLETRVNQLDQRVLELQKTVLQQQSQIEALTAGQLARKLQYHKPATQAKTAQSTQDSQALAKELDRIAGNIDSTIKTEKGATTTAPNDERDTYTAAYLAYKSNKFDESISTFRALLGKYPDGEYSDQAYYWLGEALLAKHKTREAARAFDTVAMKFPDSGKHAMALLRLANAYTELKRRGDARAALQRLMREHPDSLAAEQAAILLRQSTERSK